MFCCFFLFFISLGKNLQYIFHLKPAITQTSSTILLQPQFMKLRFLNAHHIGAKRRSPSWNFPPPNTSAPDCRLRGRFMLLLAHPRRFYGAAGASFPGRSESSGTVHFCFYFALIFLFYFLLYIFPFIYCLMWGNLLHFWWKFKNNFNNFFRKDSYLLKHYFWVNNETKFQKTSRGINISIWQPLCLCNGDQIQPEIKYSSVAHIFAEPKRQCH